MVGCNKSGGATAATADDATAASVSIDIMHIKFHCSATLSMQNFQLKIIYQFSVGKLIGHSCFISICNEPWTDFSTIKISV